MSLNIFLFIFSINIKIDLIFIRIYYYMSDLINKSIDELIEFCKEKGINYLTKTKKANG